MRAFRVSWGPCLELKREYLLSCVSGSAVRSVACSFFFFAAGGGPAFNPFLCFFGVASSLFWCFGCVWGGVGWLARVCCLPCNRLEMPSAYPMILFGVSDVLRGVQFRALGLLRARLSNDYVWSDWKNLIDSLVPLFRGRACPGGGGLGRDRLRCHTISVFGAGQQAGCMYCPPPVFVRW